MEFDNQWNRNKSPGCLPILQPQQWKLDKKLKGDSALLPCMSQQTHTKNTIGPYPVSITASKSRWWINTKKLLYKGNKYGKWVREQ